MEDLSKQAILDAKQLRAHITAITKASLEEQFGPTMKKMIQESLEEELDEVDEMEEGKAHPKKPIKQEGKKEQEIEEAEEIEEGEEIEEAEEIEEGEEIEEAYDEEIEEAEEMEEGEDSELEEVLRELNSLSEYEAELEEGDDEEESEEGGEEGIEDDMPAEEDEDQEEIVITFGQLKQALAPFMGEEGDEEGFGGEEDFEDSEEINVDEDLEESQISEPFTKSVSAPKSQKKNLGASIAGKSSQATSATKKQSAYNKPASVKQEAKHEDKEKKHMEETIKRLQQELKETNLLSAKNLYMNKIFAKRSLSESQKLSVINSFDKAKTVNQVKTVYESLVESIETKTKKTSIRESVGFASKAAGVAPSKGNIVEADENYMRWQILAGLKK